VSRDIIIDLKSHARVLHRRAVGEDPAALRRLRILPEFSRLPDDLLAQSLKRRHCLTAVARQLGFQTWAHALAVLAGDENQADFGTLLYPTSCHGHYNIWSASYDEAREIRAANSGYLLAYRRQFLVVDASFIESMGVDPSDPDWELIGRDWVRPVDRDARGRLYRQLVQNALVTLVLRERQVA
jgi:hypothetical protein